MSPPTKSKRRTVWYKYSWAAAACAWRRALSAVPDAYVREVSMIPVPVNVTVDEPDCPEL